MTITFIPTKANEHDNGTLVGRFSASGFGAGTFQYYHGPVDWLSFIGDEVYLGLGWHFDFESNRLLTYDSPSGGNIFVVNSPIAVKFTEDDGGATTSENITLSFSDINESISITPSEFNSYEYGASFAVLTSNQIESLAYGLGSESGVFEISGANIKLTDEYYYDAQNNRLTDSNGTYYDLEKNFKTLNVNSFQTASSDINFRANVDLTNAFTSAQKVNAKIILTPLEFDSYKYGATFAEITSNDLESFAYELGSSSSVFEISGTKLKLTDKYYYDKQNDRLTDSKGAYYDLETNFKTLSINSFQTSSKDVNFRDNIDLSNVFSAATKMSIPYYAATPTVAKSKSGLNSTDSILFDVPEAWSNNQNYENGTSTTITYSFYSGSDVSQFSENYTVPDPKVDNIFSFNAAQQDAVSLALQQWSNFADITFVKVDETSSQVGTLRFAFTDHKNYIGETDALAAGWASKPDAIPSSGDVWINADDKDVIPVRGQDYLFKTYMHEIGHALGLDHPFEGEDQLPSSLDFRNYTIMSYTDPENHYFYDGDGDYNYLISSTPMVFDIAAVQHLYGATSHNTADTVYKYDPSKPVVEAIWDSDGIDTLDFSNFGKALDINLTAGAYSTIAFTSWSMTDNLGIAFGTIIEKAIGGAGNDTITGNSADNTLYGGAGDDVISAGDGNDILYCGPGNDTLSGGLGADEFRFYLGDGINTITDFSTGIDTCSFFNSDGSKIASSEVSTGKTSSNEIKYTLADGTSVALEGVDFGTPFITSALTASVDENSPISNLAYTTAAIDLDTEALQFSLTGTDASYFEIGTATGNISFKESPDYESKSTYTFSVTASDGSSSDIETIILSINDVNEAPIINSNNTITVAENSVNSTIIYDANAVDEDGDKLTYSLANGIRIETSGEGANGEIDINLFEQIAPLHSARISELAGKGSYDNIVFHRVIDGFMAQTGDVEHGQLDGDWSLSGSGGSDQPDLPAEFSQTVFDRGIVGMARASNLNSANSQFFIMFEDYHSINGQYTVIGEVTSGMDVVDLIKKGAGANGKVLGQPDVMKTVSLLGHSETDLFQINSETGEVTLKFKPDFDTKPTYTFDVIVSDGAETDYQTVTLSVTDADSIVAALVNTRSGVAQKTVELTISSSQKSASADEGSSEVAWTDETGSFTLKLDNGVEIKTAAELGYSSSTKAISSQDALDALKLSVGLSTSAGTKDAFDFMSADFNQDGKVSSQDALSILKYSVGLPTSEQAKWVFVDTNGDYSGISKSNTSYTEGVSIADLSADTTVSLTGILIGDVNDSYSGLIA